MGCGSSAAKKQQGKDCDCSSPTAEPVKVAAEPASRDRDPAEVAEAQQAAQGAVAAAVAAVTHQAPAAAGDPKNFAFVFVKPNALTDAFQAAVKAKFEEVGIKITSEGELTGEVIDEKKLVDQHYYSIASKATLLQPCECNVPKDKFKDHFGVEWDEVLKSGAAYNAVDACSYLGMNAAEIDVLWQAAKNGKKDWTKLGGGFQCARLEVEGKEPIFVFNGFFMSMRAKFTVPGPNIHYYTVEWDPTALSWADFRGKILGATDPAEAAADSLRGKAFADWEALGMAGKPWIGENGIHASASPVEAMAERCNWLEGKVSEDVFGKAMLAAGIPEEMIEAWRKDPQVKIGEGKNGSLFDQIEDMDWQPCLAKCVELAKLQAE
eukprot:TRINITY_DN70654_c0_g1_i1.p1 TRINITY_DN70654_c0_g1~~TRINITY_DN70654_c0_g1_i1.p1  ORF type:complete len:379 (+),score=93.86 TRINITY_DN70654_c0_g1_i1:55-1191(+)